jgi:uncharacterized membrane protein YccC
MGPSGDEIGRKGKETREQIDEDFDALEQDAEQEAARYVRIAAIVVGAVVVVTAGVLIYRRMQRPARREQLRRMLVEALEDVPDVLRELPDEVARKYQAAAAVVQSGRSETEAKVRSVFDRMIRRARD